MFIYFAMLSDDKDTFTAMQQLPVRLPFSLSVSESEIKDTHAFSDSEVGV